MNRPVQSDIRGVLIQVAGARLLLPNATIAEVLSFADPDAIDNAPDWLLGRIRWRGWQLPLVAFSRLVTVSEAALVTEETDRSLLPRGVAARVALNDDEALVPDLAQLEQLIGETLREAA